MNTDRYFEIANRLVRDPDDPIALVDMFAMPDDKADFTYHYWLSRRAWLVEKTLNTVFNYGSACYRVGKFHDALELFRQALSRCPAGDEWEAKCIRHIGIAYRALGRNQKAIDAYQAAYALCGDKVILRDIALATLAKGDLVEGLKIFEVRREIAEDKHRATDPAQQEFKFGKLPDDVVHWQGEYLDGKTICVYHEEGAGDFVQWCRVVPRLRHLGAKEVHLTGRAPDLLELVAANIDVDGIHPLAGPIPTDFVIGSASLPWRLGIEYKDISGEPYFSAEPDPDLKKRGALNVGLVWHGNPDYGANLHRSMAFANFCPLFDLPGVAFYSLQCGPPMLEVTQLGMDGFVASLEPRCSTWKKTAGVVQALDLVVTVDTAIAHVAGALGKDVFLLNRQNGDWRWPSQGEKTPWYNSMRVIRQKKLGEWDYCITRVKDLIKERLSERRRQAV